MSSWSFDVLWNIKFCNWGFFLQRQPLWFINLWPWGEKWKYTSQAPNHSSGGCQPKNRVILPPKWMIYSGKPYQNWWFGGTIIFGNTLVSISLIGIPFTSLFSLSKLQAFESHFPHRQDTCTRRSSPAAKDLRKRSFNEIRLRFYVPTSWKIEFSFSLNVSQSH